MGFSSMYFRSSKRFDRASLVEGFKQIKDRGVRYEDLFPGSYDPAARVEEILEDQIDAEVIFNGVGTVWTGIKLCPDKELALACYKVYNDWIADFQAYAPERFVCNGTLPTTGLDDAIAELHRCAELGLRTVQLESYPSGSFSDPTPEDDRFWAAAVELGMPINVHTQFFFPVGDLGSKITADGVQAGRDRAKKLGLDVQAGSFPVILWRMMQSGVFERFPDLKFVGYRGAHRMGARTTSSASTSPCCATGASGTCRCCRASTSARTCRSCTSSTRSARTTATTSASANIMWGPDFPHSSSAWPVDYELGSRDPRAGGRQRERDRADHVEERGRHLQGRRTRRRDAVGVAA